jgi:outer membrane protein assembly factor BamB
VRTVTPALIVACVALASLTPAVSAQIGSARRGAAAAQPVARAAPSLTAAPADEWRQFRGTPRLTGVSASTPPATLKVLWTYELGDVVDSSAAIVGGVVYVGGGSGDLVALDLDSGTLRWKYTTGNLIGESSPTVTRDTVFVGDLGGVFHAVNIADGKARWTFKTMSEIKASPVVVGDVVLVGSYDAHLYALDAGTGQLRWKVETNGQVHATPAVQDGLAFIAGCDSILRAIRVTNGTEAYRIASGAYTGASPLLDGGRAYFGTFNNEVLAFDLRAKKRLWRYADPTRQFPFYSSAALANGRVILGGRDKFIHAIDANTGKAAWTFATRARVDSSPVVAGGRVYVGSGDGRLYVLDAATGTKISEFDAGAGITASPALADGRIIIGTQDGRLYALG